MDPVTKKQLTNAIYSILCNGCDNQYINGPNVSLVHIWKSIERRSSFAKKKIQLYWSTHAEPTIQLGGINLKLSPLIGITTSTFVWKPYQLSLRSFESWWWQLTSWHIFTPCQKKRQLISERVKGPLVAVFRSPLMKVLDNSDLNVSSMNCNFSVTLIKSLNQSSIKPCLTVHLVAMWTLI